MFIHVCFPCDGRAAQFRRRGTERVRRHRAIIGFYSIDDIPRWGELRGRDLILKLRSSREGWEEKSGETKIIRSAQKVEGEITGIHRPAEYCGRLPPQAHLLSCLASPHFSLFRSLPPRENPAFWCTDIVFNTPHQDCVAPPLGTVRETHSPVLL